MRQAPALKLLVVGLVGAILIASTGLILLPIRQYDQFISLSTANNTEMACAAGGCCCPADVIARGACCCSRHRNVSTKDHMDRPLKPSIHMSKPTPGVKWVIRSTSCVTFLRSWQIRISEYTLHASSVQLCLDLPTGLLPRTGTVRYHINPSPIDPPPPRRTLSLT